MGSLIRSVPREVFRMNFSGCRKLLLSYHISNSIPQMRNLVIRKSKLNFLSKKIIFRKYSTDTSGIRGGCCVTGDKNEVNEDESEHEDEFSSGDDKYDNQDELQEDEAKQKREEIFKEIAQGDPDLLKKLKLLEFEIAVLKEQGWKVVTNPSKSQWEELLSNFDKTLHFKLKMLQFMGLNERRNLIKLKRKRLLGLKKLSKREEDGFHYYGMSGHCMLPIISEKSVNNLNALRLMRAEQKILFDCSYQEFMGPVSTKNTAKQIHMCVNEALNHHYPCRLKFYNLNQNDILAKILPRYLPRIYDETFYCDVSSQHFLDFYPKDRLVYLSPHSPNDLMEFNKEDIYIIGAFVDKESGVKASLAKAKKEQLRVARLPLDQYLLWRQGSKSLPLNVILKILLDMYYYNDWSIAFRNISSRFTRDPSLKKDYISENEEEEL